MGKTLQNFKMAFAGESQANRKYLAFAEKADKEGFPQAAKLFRAAAEAETIHAMAHLRAMKAIGSTKENLKAAVSGETEEYKDMYPTMLEEAKVEGENAAERLFMFAAKAEQNHAELYQATLDNLNAQLTEEYYICPACGYLEKGKKLEKCPVCNVSGDKFYSIG